MSLSVISFGLGRTGTLSLKQALEQLGFGPCHHMTEVDEHDPAQLALWQAAAKGDVDWNKAYAGYRSACDWPTAAFCRELTAAFPDAKVMITVRDPEKWVESFSSTIGTLTTSSDAPPEVQPFLDMVIAMLRKTGFTVPATKEQLLEGFHRHLALVKATVPAGQLLVFDVKEGWAPLCAFLGVPVPATPFPRTNNREDFWADPQSDGVKR